MKSSLLRILILLPVSFFLSLIVNVRSAELSADTLKTWMQFVEAQEKRIDGELSSQSGFLALDFQEAKISALERREVLAGNISIKPLQAGEIRVPGGIIHHWRGGMFVPGISLEFVLSRLQHPELETSKQEDVLESRVLERSPQGIRLFLKLQRSRIVTAVYNTEHLLRFYRHGNGKASSRSISLKIAEIERINDNIEREKPEGKDRGFLWKMNSYWRYQQVAGGVIIECESITLSRSIPFLLDALIRPIIEDIARESLQRTLYSLRIRLQQAHSKTMASR